MTSCHEDQECGLCPHLIVTNVNSLQVTSSEPYGICRRWRRFAGVTQQNQLCGSKGGLRGCGFPVCVQNAGGLPAEEPSSSGKQGKCSMRRGTRLGHLRVETSGFHHLLPQRQERSQRLSQVLWLGCSGRPRGSTDVPARGGTSLQFWEGVPPAVPTAAPARGWCYG